MHFTTNLVILHLLLHKLVNLQELLHASVDAHGLPLVQIFLVIPVSCHALGAARVDHTVVSEVEEGGGRMDGEGGKGRR